MLLQRKQHTEVETWQFKQSSFVNVIGTPQSGTSNIKKKNMPTNAWSTAKEKKRQQANNDEFCC